MNCYLMSSDNCHEAILLPDNEPVFIGRNPNTKISEARCSRQQVELRADYTKREVSVKQLGSNNSALDKTDLVKGTTLKMKEGSTLYVLSGLYPHHIKFTLLAGTNNGLDTSQNKKRKLSDNADIDRDAGMSNKISRLTHATAVDTNESHKHEQSDDVDVVRRKLEQLKKSKQPAKEDPGESNGIKHVSRESASIRSDRGRSDSVQSDRGPSDGGRSVVEADSWWEHDKLCVFVSQGLTARNRIAAFDIDGTIICTKSGRVFPKDMDDWRLWHTSVATKIQKLHHGGYKIVFFTNQLGVSRGKTNLADLKEKFEKLVKQIQIPVQILISTSSGYYRKPAKGMWTYLTEQGNNGLAVNLAESFYVGDAAGRKDKWAPGRKKDFSCSDRLFALNLGLRFYTPEEFFLKSTPVSYTKPDFDPRNSSPHLSLLEPADAQLVSDKPEIIVTVGFPASGKSTFVRENLIPKGYVHISRDNLGSWQKCVAAGTKAVKEGTSVVIDNTNPDRESRKRYTDTAKKLGVGCRCFWLTTTHTQSRHNERYREMTDTSHQPISDMILHSYKSKFVEPMVAEGFSEIIRVNCLPKFVDTETKTLYHQFLLEK